MDESFTVLLLVILLSVWASTNGTRNDEPSGPVIHCGLSQYDNPGIAGGFQISSNIVAGWQARPNEFPWQVALVYGYGSKPFCGGSIIDDWYIITAAHCLIDNGYGYIQVVAVRHRMSDHLSGSRYSVSEIIIHSDYDNNVLNDIALLKVSSPIALSNSVYPICLPTLPSSKLSGTSLIVSGWGNTQSGGSSSDVLLYTRVDLMSRVACRECFGKLVTISDGMLCAGNCGDNGADSCQGDSGGPLFREREDGTFELTGIVSWGIGCASDKPGVYADVYEYIDWIRMNDVHA